ncbi:MAG: adenylyl-sulfate kinase [Bacteroidota bacterium]
MLIIQLTGLSGAGKTTISNYVKQKLAEQAIKVEIIDGDIYRKTLCADLGFSREDRCENIRRLANAALTFGDTCDVAIIAAINPFEEVREELRASHGVKTVWINCSVDVLIERDTKGLYQRALLPADHPDKLHNLTGINDNYDKPLQCDLIINTHAESIESSVDALCSFILSNIGRHY